MKPQTGPDTKITNFQFQSIATDPERIFQKIQYRIQGSNTVQIGVHPVWRYISVASVLLLVALSSLYLLSGNNQPEPVSTQHVEMVTLNNSKAKVLLPDQSAVWMNSDSYISYPATFSGQERDIFLTGDALFTIKKDSLSYFTIHTNGIRIEVLGTTFYVNSREDKETIETVLIEGEIALYKENNLTGIPDITLSPDQQAIFHKNNGEIEICSVESALYTSWTNNTFLFEKTPLSEIVAALERAYGVTIQIRNPQLKNMKLTARFVHNESLEEILSVLRITGRFKWEKEKNGTIRIQ